jgi:hypothetical protein
MAEALKEHSMNTNELKEAGAVFTPGRGWAFPDPDTGTCWFDETSDNGTVFLGENAEDAHEEMLRLKTLEESE